MSIQETMENFLNTLRGQAGQAEEIPELMGRICELLHKYFKHYG